jgi:hypothetical protein
MDPCAIRPRNQFTPKVNGPRYLCKYTSAPTTNAMSGIREHEHIVTGLSELDVHCNLSKQVRKTGRYLHALVEVRRLV